MGLTHVQKGVLQQLCQDPKQSCTHIYPSMTNHIDQERQLIMCSLT